MLSAEPVAGASSRRLVASCLVAAAATWALSPEPAALRAGLTLFVLIGGLWLTAALPLAVTALLVPVLAVLWGLADLRTALTSFAHPVIFLFLGGFALAAALQRQGLDVALTHFVLRRVGGRRLPAVLLLCALAALLSMWMSNTATAAMMLPLALGLLPAPPPPTRHAKPAEDAADSPPITGETVFVLLALAYSCSIGGMATLVGSPPNAIAAAQAGIGFAQWLAYGLPAALLLWPLMLLTLWWLLRPRLEGRVAAAQAVGFEWTRERVLTLVIFGLTAAGWVGGQPLAQRLGLGPGTDVDSLVALAAVVALVASGCLGWRDLERQTPWGVLLLFGGGLALSALMQSSGASAFLAERVLALAADVPRLLLLLAVIAFVVFLTELVSNTASAALVLPVLLPVAASLGLSPPATAAAVALAASCAFMLPVATPPNAMVFATERVGQLAMMRCGLALNLLAIAVLTLLTGWR